MARIATEEPEIAQWASWLRPGMPGMSVSQVATHTLDITDNTPPHDLTRTDPIMKALAFIIFWIIAVTVGWNIASSGKPEVRTEVVRVEVPKYITETQTVTTVEKQVTPLPESCLKAIAETDNMQTLISDLSAKVAKQNQAGSDLARDSLSGDLDGTVKGQETMMSSKAGVDSVTIDLSKLKQSIDAHMIDCKKDMK